MVAPLHVYHPLAVEIRDRLRKQFPARTIVACENAAALEAEISEVEVLLTGVLAKHLLAKAARLRWIQYMGAGVDSLLPAPELDESVQISCTRGLFAAQVAEHAIGLLISLHRGFASHHQSQLDKQWRPFSSSPLAGQTLVVIGLGEIGSRVARIAAAMNMCLVGVTRTGLSDPSLFAATRIVASDELHSALGQAAALVLTCPLTRQTRHIIGAPELAAMQPSSLLVNIGRGSLIDESALLTSLRGGHLGGAALDVFETEPLPPSSLLWTAPNTIVTPHCSGTAVGRLQTIGDFFATNVIRFDSGRPLLNSVDRELGY